MFSVENGENYLSYSPSRQGKTAAESPPGCAKGVVFAGAGKSSAAAGHREGTLRRGVASVGVGADESGRVGLGIGVEAGAGRTGSCAAGGQPARPSTPAGENVRRESARKGMFPQYPQVPVYARSGDQRRGWFVVD